MGGDGSLFWRRGRCQSGVKFPEDPQAAGADKRGTVGARGGEGCGWGILGPQDKGRVGHAAWPDAPLPHRAHPGHAGPAGSVSKDACLFLEKRFISFHFNCLLLS